MEWALGIDLARSQVGIVDSRLGEFLGNALVIILVSKNSLPSFAIPVLYFPGIKDSHFQIVSCISEDLNEYSRRLI